MAGQRRRLVATVLIVLVVLAAFLVVFVILALILTVLVPVLVIPVNFELLATALKLGLVLPRKHCSAHFRKHAALWTVRAGRKVTYK